MPRGYTNLFSKIKNLLFTVNFRAVNFFENFNLTKSKLKWIDYYIFLIDWN